jgi:Family of unknown function (DUF5898)
MWNTQVELTILILFPDDDIFNVWRQLGCGDTGVCCSATVEQQSKPRHHGMALKSVEINKIKKSIAIACVIKFYRTEKGAADQAKKEADIWKVVYTNIGRGFVHATMAGSVPVVVMLYLDVSKTRKERELLMDGEDENCELWKGLSDFSQKGFKHNDLKWDQIGILKCSSIPKTVVLLNLRNATKFHDDENWYDWVKTSFVALNKRA